MNIFNCSKYLVISASFCVRIVLVIFRRGLFAVDSKKFGHGMEVLVVARMERVFFK